MSSPSFLVRLRTRARRLDGDAVLQLPEDHWHSGDPRMLDGSLALRVHDVSDVPAPRRPTDRPVAGQRPDLTVVPAIDVRASVVDLRPAPSPSTPPVERPWTETSTWLG